MRRRLAVPGRTNAACSSTAEPEPSPALRELVAGAFAHRRTALAGSLALSGRSGGHSREQVRAALQRLGHPADARAERLSPEDFRELSRLLEP
jgi:16S rRNA (adenine1518-N6/adenine1519-N6)-dimethyltransferase